MIDKAVHTFATLVLAAGLVWSGAVSAAPEGSVATVNGTAISRARLDSAVEMQMQTVAEEVAAGISPQDRQALRDVALDQLIAFELLWQEAKTRDLQVEEHEIDEVFANRRAMFETRDEFLSQLEALGFDEQSYRDNLRRSLAVKKLIDAEREAVEVSQEEVRAFYEAQPEAMRRPEEIHARHILIKVDPEADAAAEATAREQAEALLARARDGEDFAQLAKLYSQGPSNERGGDLGFFGRGRMVPAFESAAFALQHPGDLSDLVQTQFGFHIIRLDGRRGGDIAPLQDVAIQIHDHLKGIKGSQRIEELEGELRNKAQIEVFVSN